MQHIPIRYNFAVPLRNSAAITAAAGFCFCSLIVVISARRRYNFSFHQAVGMMSELIG